MMDLPQTAEDFSLFLHHKYSQDQSFPVCNGFVAHLFESSEKSVRLTAEHLSSLDYKDSPAFRTCIRRLQQDVSKKKKNISRDISSIITKLD